MTMGDPQATTDRTLRSPFPIAASMPALYESDDFMIEFAAALDEIVAPVTCALDSFHAYLSVSTAPSDFVDWLASWLGIQLDHDADPDERRKVVSAGAETLRLRGTLRGLEMTLALAGVEVEEITDSGAVAWSPAPNGDLPGEADLSLRIIVRLARGAGSDTQRRKLNRVLAQCVPAHVAVHVDFVTT